MAARRRESLMAEVSVLGKLRLVELAVAGLKETGMVDEEWASPIEILLQEVQQDLAAGASA